MVEFLSRHRWRLPVKQYHNRPLYHSPEQPIHIIFSVKFAAAKSPCIIAWDVLAVWSRSGASIAQSRSSAWRFCVCLASFKVEGFSGDWSCWAMKNERSEIDTIRCHFITRRKRQICTADLKLGMRRCTSKARAYSHGPDRRDSNEMLIYSRRTVLWK